MAGRGGLNLTHSEPFENFLRRYGAAATRLKASLEAFPPSALVDWCEGLGQPTFTGTSGRVFPKAMKASPLLRAWLARLAALQVTVMPRHRWLGWSPGGNLAFQAPDGRREVSPDVTIAALGGASWPRLGSDGRWTAIVAEQGIAVSPLRASNCGFAADFSETFRKRFAGEPLKGIALRFDGLTVRGEAVITNIGLEGGAIYVLSAPLRNMIEKTGNAVLRIDLRPNSAADSLMCTLSKARQGESLSNRLRKAARLSPVSIGLLNEAAYGSGRLLSSLSIDELAAFIKDVPVTLTGTAPVDRAISSAGGIPFEETGAGFMLRAKPGVFAAGEMLDWEAPTGGYLLQACFATGYAAARGALAWLGAQDCH